MKHLSRPTLLALITLLGIGIVQVYSSSYIHAIESRGDGMFFLKRQLTFALISFFTLVACAKIPLAWLRKAAWPIFIVSIILLAGTLVPGMGIRAGGAIRWLKIPGGFVFESSEFFKLALPFAFAHVLYNWRDWSYAYRTLAVGMLCIPFAILLKQPDFGTFAIGISIIFCVLFVHGLRWSYIFATALAAIPAFYFLVWSVPYRKVRVLAFLDPWSDPATKGFQIIQSLLSLQSGGLTGVGIGQSQGKLFYLPEAHTDFTLAILGEETGWIGILVLSLLFGFLVIQGLRVVWKTQDEFWKTVALGLTSCFALSVFINMGVVLGMLPTKGLSLPFISYGGSSLLMQGMLFGILLNIQKSVESSNSLGSTPWKKTKR